jgi:hypothetical protein
MGLLLFDAWICDRFHIHWKLPLPLLAGNRAPHLDWHIGDLTKDMSGAIPVCGNSPIFLPLAEL